MGNYSPESRQSYRQAAGPRISSNNCHVCSEIAVGVTGGAPHPERNDLQGTELEREILEHVENHSIDLMRRYNIENESISTNTFRCDATRANLPTETGWARSDEEASALAEVHAASFGSAWTPDLYRKVMVIR
ncbi:MAG: hypothetical protein HN368_08975 [Spirochaetales bacterium]|nr:hypothetical protein [Spirochaetales bacterium]